MKFELQRTSQSVMDNRAPCEGAFLQPGSVEDKSMPHYSVFLRPGYKKPNVWLIEIETLEQLMEFVATHGQVVVSPIDPCVRDREAFPEIEIYDEYRE